MLDLTVDERGGGGPPLLHQERGRVAVATLRDGGAGYHRCTKRRARNCGVALSDEGRAKVRKRGGCVFVCLRERERESGRVWSCG